jgi:DNA processing protein
MSIASLISRAVVPETIHPDFLEMGAYEALWERQGATFKTVSEQIKRASSGRAAELVVPDLAERNAREVLKRLSQAKVSDVGVHIFGAPDYPSKLCDARYPLRAFYYRGDWDLVKTRSVAVVGARQITEEGVARTRRLVRYLVEDGVLPLSPGLLPGPIPSPTQPHSK